MDVEKQERYYFRIDLVWSFFRGVQLYQGHIFYDTILCTYRPICNGEINKFEQSSEKSIGIDEEETQIFIKGIPLDVVKEISINSMLLSKKAC